MELIQFQVLSNLTIILIILAIPGILGMCRTISGAREVIRASKEQERISKSHYEAFKASRINARS